MMMPNLTKVLTPTGVLRASLNISNVLLAGQNASGEPYGVSVDISRALAERLGVGIEFVVFNSVVESVVAVSSNRADVGFFAIDPKRGESIAFTDPYLLIEGWYAVPESSPIRNAEEVDRAGVRMAVVQDSAYDLFLSRELKQAELVRAPDPQAVISLFLDQRLDVLAGVKQQLQADMARHPGLRLLPQRFMVIRQAMGLARDRGSDAQAYLCGFVEELKSNGFIAQALERHGIQGANLAPPAG